MTTEALKSTPITNLDSSPFIQNTIGEGAPGFLREVEATLTITTGKTSGSTYRMVRLPPNAKVKSVEAWCDVAVTTATFDIGIYYSDATNDGTTNANQGLVINADHFGSAVALAAVVTPTEYTFEATTYIGADTLKELWNTTASGLTANPGGMIDVVLTNTSTNSGAAVVNVRVRYVV